MTQAALVNVSEPDVEVEGHSAHSDQRSVDPRAVASQLLSLLREKGVGPADMADMTSALDSMGGGATSAGTTQPEDADQVTRTNVITLYLAEEQEIIREAYRSIFAAQSTIEVTGSSGDVTAEALAEAVTSVKPSVLILGVKTLNQDAVDKLEAVRNARAETAIVLLFAFYDAQGMEALREFIRESSSGCAYLLKHTIDTGDQLTQAVSSVAEGRIIVDPVVMEELVRGKESKGELLNELTPKALEVLSWIAKGYRNDTIAKLLSRDVKTIERHINNIYSVLDQEEDDTSKHPRVLAALRYLRATGSLSNQQPI